MNSPHHNKTGKKQPARKSCKIKLCTLNIHSSLGDRHEDMLWAMQHLNVDVGILMEVNITGNQHMPWQCGYNILISKAPRQHLPRWCSIILVIQPNPNLMAAQRPKHGLRFLTFGHTGWLIIGAYISPSF